MAGNNQLGSTSSMTVGLLNERLFHDYPTGVLRGAARHARKSKTNLVSLNGGAFRHPRVYHRAPGFLFDLGHADLFDGLILVMSQIGTRLTEEEQLAEVRRFTEHPVVIIGNPLPGVPSVCADNHGGMYRAVDHLITEHGHERILFVAGTEGNIESEVRLSGYRECLQSHGIAPNRELLAYGDFTYESGMELTERILTEGRILPGRDFTAVAAANDEMLRGIMESLERYGYHAPEQIACVGFDNSRASTSAVPSITTIHQHHEELGETALRILQQLVAGEEVPEVTLVESELIIRDSCGCGYDQIGPLSGGIVTSALEEERGPEEILDSARVSYQLADLLDVEQSFHDAIDGESHKYLRKLRYFLRRIATRVDRTGALRTVLESIAAAERDGTSERDARVNELLAESRIILSDHLENVAETELFTVVEEFYRLRRAGFSALTSPDSSYFATELKGSLYWLRISYCSIVLFDSGEPARKDLRIPKTGRVGLSYRLPVDDRAIHQDEVISTLDLFPPGDRPPGSPYVVIVEPLYFLETAIGYMIISDELKNLIGYDHLSASISAMLMDERDKEDLRRVNAELSETNRRLMETIRERDLARDRMVEQAKMAALGTIFAGIAHDVSTPLGNGVMLASHLTAQLDELEKSIGKLSDDQRRKALREIGEGQNLLVRNIERAAEQLASFKRTAAGQASDTLTEFDLRAYMNDIVSSHRQQLKRHSVNIRAPDYLRIVNYPGVFAQILGNLLTNSVLHGFTDGKKGTITIDVAREDNMLAIRYRDNGQGMTEEVVRRVFEPFFTTKLGQGGSGLGMYIIYNLVTTKLRGQISCASRRGAGVDIQISVPANVPADTEFQFADSPAR
jgi:DNA-binding LacI/PurR family transcriptional regulator/signal transduction histidine kinase